MKNGSSQRPSKAPILCGIDLKQELGANQSRCFKCFESGEKCRDYADSLSSDVPIAVGNGMRDVSALNMIAALRKDSPNREIYLVSESDDERYLSMAREAGSSEIISYDQLYSALFDIQTANGLSLGETAGSQGICLSFLSGRGGVGKSTLSVMFSAISNDSGLKTVLVDMDSQFGDTSYLCGKDANFREFELIDDPGNLDVIRKTVGSGKVALLRSTSLPEFSDDAGDEFKEVLGKLREISEVIFVNTGSYWMGSHADVALESDVCIFVMDQRPASVNGCKEAMELAIRIGTPAAKFAYLLNKSSQKNPISSFDCALTLGIDEVVQVSDGGADVGEFLALGNPSILLESGNRAVEDCREALEGLLVKFAPTLAPRLDATRPRKSSRLKSGRIARRFGNNVAAR